MRPTENINIRFPKNLQEALRLQAKAGTRGQLLAGGTDLMVQWVSGTPPPRRATSVWNLPELCEIEVRDKDILIGAGVTHAFLVDATPIHRHLPALVAAAGTVGAAQIQARGTLGGNVANASPAGDTAPALLVTDGTVLLASLGGIREVPLTQFWTGYRQIDARPDEIIQAFRLPKKGAARERFRKIGTRKAQAISKIMAASRIRVRKGQIVSAAIALGSIAATPVRLTQVEDFLAGKPLTAKLITDAEQLAQKTVQPIADIRSTAEYRRWVTGRLVRDALENL
ncbi:MAG: xanthine dehydrogenase family protein subunit M [Lentisphaerae bacterium]|jgi:carbon-monoxide dehydrogenase medium subunit|nr:xanthine dehydrogenase family protein subunit M [Lentisphaerota bacterium]